MLQTTFKLQVQSNCTPLQLLTMILNKKSVTSNSYERSGDYVLKVCGKQEYLLGEHELIRFQYIQDTLAQDEQPTLVTVAVCNVPGTPVSLCVCVWGKGVIGWLDCSGDRRPAPTHGELGVEAQQVLTLELHPDAEEEGQVPECLGHPPRTEPSHLVCLSAQL